MLKTLALAAALAVGATASHAATIVNLSANPPSPNAGNNSGGYTYNPVTLILAAGTYAARVVGIAGGGAYDAYSVYAPTSSNLAYTDGNWSVSPAGGSVQTQASTTRFNTTADALSYYGALAPLTFTLASAATVAFYLDDTAFPYFADDAGGVSLSISQVQVPEPASMALLGGGIAALGMLRRRARKTA